mmetsp:Transcript_22061/g.74776  ORF Transcript_22061/g.74776 Transcript_22061/m.74776 type:complete len:201 (-) Transcript_22061:1734-2336(-)
MRRDLVDEPAELKVRERGRDDSNHERACVQIADARLAQAFVLHLDGQLPAVQSGHVHLRQRRRRHRDALESVERFFDRHPELLLDDVLDLAERRPRRVVEAARKRLSILGGQEVVELGAVLRELDVDASVGSDHREQPLRVAAVQRLLQRPGLGLGAGERGRAGEDAPARQCRGPHAFHPLVVRLREFHFQARALLRVLR